MSSILHADYIVVGSGLTGATIARLLEDAGREVLVLERRTHVGGNVHDYLHPSGLRVHTYGPHYFRTGSQKIWRYVNRFGKFYEYKAEILSYVDGQYEHWPIVDSCITRFAGRHWAPGFTGVPKNFEEASLSMMPRLIYEKFILGYTQKQWGVSPQTLGVDLAKRYQVRSDGDFALSRHPHQGLPREGYGSLMKQMLNGIPVLTRTDYLENTGDFKPRKMLIFTGPIDEFFSFKLGRLKYRAQHRKHEFLPNVSYVQPAAQVNNPSEQSGPHIRTLEWKHLVPHDASKGIRGSVVTTETPYTPVDPDAYEYPFPDMANQELFRSYARLAAAIPALMICGRLGEYRYFDMDQAIGRAMTLARIILTR